MADQQPRKPRNALASAFAIAAVIAVIVFFARTNRPEGTTAVVPPPPRPASTAAINAVTIVIPPASTPWDQALVLMIPVRQRLIFGVPDSAIERQYRDFNSRKWVTDTSAADAVRLRSKTEEAVTTTYIAETP